MSTTGSPRAKGRGTPEGELRQSGLVQVRSGDGRRLLGEVSEYVADELVRRSLCSAKLSTSGKRRYLRLLIPEDELPSLSSVASLKTIRLVKGQPNPDAERGNQYFEHRFPESAAIADRTRLKR